MDPIATPRRELRVTDLVLEVAENNELALAWYRERNFRKLDAAIFVAQTIETEPELVSPRELPPPGTPDDGETLV